MININAIFPIAGKGERFGGTFKPKLIFNGRTFLENAVDTIKSDKRINPKFYFICNYKQEREENVVEWINSIYPEAKVIVIPDQTSGPVLPGGYFFHCLSSNFTSLFQTTKSVLIEDLLILAIGGQYFLGFLGCINYVYGKKQ